MNLFSIRDIENLTGIRAHTLRIWEQRYGILKPKRKASLHRLYDNEDLKSILRISYLYNRGFKISKIASLGPEEIQRLALHYDGGGDRFEILINQLVEASIDLDPEKFGEILQRAIQVSGFQKCMTQIVFPMLNKIGMLWLTGNVIPAQEHFASTLISRQLMLHTDRLPFPVKSSGRQVLLFTPVGEHHEIPLLFMQYLLRKNQVSCCYVGTNASLETLESVCRHRPVTELYFHLITNFIRCKPDEYLEKLSASFPSREIYFCCQSWAGEKPLPANVKRLNDARALIAYAG